MWASNVSRPSSRERDDATTPVQPSGREIRRLQSLPAAGPLRPRPPVRRRRGPTWSSCSSTTWATPTSAVTARRTSARPTSTGCAEGTRMTDFYSNGPVCSPDALRLHHRALAAAGGPRVGARGDQPVLRPRQSGARSRPVLAARSQLQAVRPARSRRRHRPSPGCWPTRVTRRPVSASGTWAGRPSAAPSCAWLRHGLWHLRRQRRPLFAQGTRRDRRPLRERQAGPRRGLPDRALDPPGRAVHRREP